jgi:methionyl-tRNA formyltransferase
MKPLRLVFLGSDAIALPLLEWLAGEGAAWAHVVGVFTQPDRAVGRGQHILPNAIKTWALAHHLPIFQPDSLTDETRQQLQALDADLSLVMAYGHILRDPLIATPRLGTLNLHASLLPKYRGASPIQTAVASGETETGVSLMRIVRRLDAGPVAAVERVPISTQDTAEQIEEKIGGACIPLLRRTLGPLTEGKLVFVAQSDPESSYCRRLTKADGSVDFHQPAREIVDRMRGLYPWPGCTIEIGGQPVKIGLAEFEEAAPTAQPGEVLSASAGALRVAARAGVVRLLKMQRPGGKMLSADEFLRGFPVPVGSLLPSRAMLPLVAREPFPYRK